MIKRKELPSKDYLNSILEYRNGKLFWKQKTSNLSRIKIGDEAGSLNATGYYTISINIKQYKIHNIIWKMFHGFDPKEQIDHINHIRTDNRIENLREVSCQDNCKNRSKIDSISGHTNIFIRKNRPKKYGVRIKHSDGKYSKLFYTLEEAIKHRDEKLIEFGFHPNHGK